MKRYPNLYRVCKDVKINDDIGGKHLKKIDEEIKMLLEALPVIDQDIYRVSQLKFVRLPSSLALFYPSNSSISLTTTVVQKGIYSFIHEFGHLIDFKNREYGSTFYSETSNDEKWLAVVKAFRDQHSKHSKKEEWFSSDQGEVKEWEQWGNYDKRLRSSVEIFARAFEVYIANTVGLKYIGKSKTSLKKQLDCYPSGKKSVQVVIDFFDWFLEKERD